jgi:protocadherin Fat 1/2/3
MTDIRYTLTVSALDMANAGMRKQSSARVTILVEDVNDNDPLFEMVDKEIWFDENEQAGTRVIRQELQTRILFSDLVN